MFKKKLDEQRGSEPQKEHNPFGKKKRKFPVKKNKLVVHRCDPAVGLSYRKISDEDSLDYDEFGGETRKIARSALVKQHDTAILLNFKLDTEESLMHEKAESAGGKKKHISRSALVKQHDRAVLLNYKPKGKASELAKRTWREFPEELKEELRKTLPDANKNEIPDAFD